MTPATVPQGDNENDMRIAISDGVLTAWRPRTSWRADGQSLDQLAKDTAAAMASRGII